MDIIFFVGIVLAGAVVSAMLGQIAAAVLEPVANRFGVVGSVAQALAICAVASWARGGWVALAALAGVAAAYLNGAVLVFGVLLASGWMAMQFGGFVGAWGFAMLLAAACCAPSIGVRWLLDRAKRGEKCAA